MEFALKWIVFHCWQASSFSMAHFWLLLTFGNVGSLLAPLPTATSGFNIAGGESWNAAPEPDTQTGRSGGYSFRRGLNIPPTVEDGSSMMICSPLPFVRRTEQTLQQLQYRSWYL